MSDERETEHRKTFDGWVVSDKMNKTRIVEVRWSKRDNEYGKVMSHSSRLFAHDEKNETHVGDQVRVAETRKLSKNKNWRITEVLNRAAGAKQ